MLFGTNHLYRDEHDINNEGIVLSPIDTRIEDTEDGTYSGGSNSVIIKRVLVTQFGGDGIDILMNMLHLLQLLIVKYLVMVGRILK